MKTTLYKINEDFLRLENEIEANEGVLTEEQEQALIINEAERDVKAPSYLEVIEVKESINTRIDEKIKHLQALKKRNKNTIDRLKYNLLNCVLVFGPFEVDLTKFGTRKSTQVITPEDINSLPVLYKDIKLTETANKKAIGAALKAGEEIKGCELKNVLNLKIN